MIRFFRNLTTKQAPMRKKLGVLTTGGTIGSTLQGKGMGVDPASTRLRDKILAICNQHDAEVEVVSVLNTISEDIEPADWAKVLKAVNDCYGRGIDRIVITHGTDTLAYTAACVALYFDQKPMHVCLTGSFYSLDHPQSDVTLNLAAAVETALSDTLVPGTYVAFRSNPTNSDASVFHAFDVAPMAFDETEFRGRYGQMVAEYSLVDGLKVDANPADRVDLSLATKRLPTSEELRGAASTVRQLVAHPGLSLTGLVDRDSKDVVIGLYHSGTAFSKEGSFSLTDFMRKGRYQIHMCAFPSRYIEHPYESTVRLIEAGARVYHNLYPHQMYVALVCMEATGLTAEERRAPLDRWLIKPADGGKVSYQPVMQMLFAKPH